MGTNPAIQYMNENGLILGIFKEARKVCDHFSHIKSNNYLAYTMAALWAKEQKLNDALLLNSYMTVLPMQPLPIFLL
jgi:branched-subunit amino acid aminotransferase/4-amino-4-deoxychorismate lyase